MFDIVAEPMAKSVDCDGCHDLSGPTSIEAIDQACMDCHEDEEERYEGMLASWQKEIAPQLLDAEARADDQQRELLERLRNVGPLHNIEATRVILRELGENGGHPAPPSTSERS